ncbi:GNAT family N-acetyltransferase [Vagococcus acidifermentans]|uniref:Uncharacterized protein n=1 Tax=Vagococcus acidifermentans TaxID=564710 RepID=A0A430B257_9ENTE|nr:GNAT family N-acetyltransferase [Vagococcus acidifermentans]RSU14414.1 hypothetical protein CBF27_00045 [Vagococcus acidifermentans]
MEFKKMSDRLMVFNDGEQKPIGEIQWELGFEDVMIIKQTHVDKDYRKQGIGEKLFEEAVKEARDNKLKIIPTCGFANQQFIDHPDKYGDVLYKRSNN